MVHGIARYRQARAGVSPEQLLVLLLRESVIRLTRVEQLPPDDPGWITDLHHVRSIVSELASALDADAAPELVSRLSALYSWALAELVRASRDRDPQLLRPVRRTLTRLLEGWEEALSEPPSAA